MKELSIFLGTILLWMSGVSTWKYVTYHPNPESKLDHLIYAFFSLASFFGGLYLAWFK